MYRITINPVPGKTNEFILTIDKNEITNRQHNFELVSRCHVKIEKGCTSYLPIPPDKDFGAFPDKIDDNIRNTIRAYYDGMNGNNSYIWIQ